MAEPFKYVPKFRDMRVRPPEQEARPSARRCEWSGCVRAGESRAPKGVAQLREFYWFCAAHAAEYNRNWDFFDGMTPGEAKAFQESAIYGHRPTWSFKTRRRADAAARTRTDWTHAFSDAFGMFDEEGPPRPPPPKVSPMQRKALATLGFNHRPSLEEVRKRYRDLLKQLHPDANGGDRSTEARFQAVIRAYQTLKTMGMG